MPPTNRIRRYLPPLLILLPVIFICGKLLLTPVDDRLDYSEVSEVGWPWVYRRTDKLGFGWNVYSSVYYSAGWLLADVATMIVAVFAVVGVLWLWQRRTLGRWQFSLRSLLAVAVLSAVVMGWYMRHEIAWRRQVHYAALWQESGLRLVDYERRTPQWARRLLPERLQAPFNRATTLDESAYNGQRLFEARDAALAALGELPDICHLELDHSTMRKPVRFRHPEALGRIKSIRCHADDETIQGLCKLPSLQTLIVHGQITDRGMEYLRHCRTLERLHVNSDQITDTGICVVFDLPRLKELEIFGCSGISPETITSLESRLPAVYYPTQAFLSPP